MKSFTELRNLFGSLTNNSATTNLTLGDELINDTIRNICESYPWNFLEKTKTMSTVASQQFYTLPYDYKKLISVTVTIGSTVYTPLECQSRKVWEDLNQSTSTTSDTPEWYFIFNGQLGFWPMPASANTDAITFTYLRATPNLSMADYTTGTIVSVANGGTAVVGSGTTWTASMVGRYLRITPSDTAANCGDGLWYEITAVGSATTLTIAKGYGGTALAAGGASFTIGEMPILPEAYHTMPVYRACEIYYSNKTEDLPRAQLFKRMFDEGLLAMKSMYGRKTTSVVINDSPTFIPNPNLNVTL